MNYHVTWLEIAIENFKKCDCIHSIKGDLTIDEFIQLWCEKELSKAIKME